jgi:hypothetical protein
MGARRGGSSFLLPGLGKQTDKQSTSLIFTALLPQVYCHQINDLKDHPRVTAADAVEHFMWADQTRIVKQLHLLTYADTQTLEGEVADLPVRDAQLVVASHNYARELNSQRRFISEFIEMLSFQNHKHEITSWKQAANPDEQFTMSNTDLVDAPMIDWETKEEYTAQARINKVSSNCGPSNR